MTRFRIDLRSDIHTVPTVEMRRAMAAADVGGDALAGEDPAVNELEETCAAMFGKEAALFVGSGTMGNIVSLLTISSPGCTLIADSYTHIVSSEAGGLQRLAGCTPILLETDGTLTGADVLGGLTSQGRLGEPGVICAENTHGLRGGRAWGAGVTAGLVKVAREHRLKLHIDGARIFNAAAASGETVADLTAGADTVQICLSKGLGAPCGSLVVGSRETIEGARGYRQMLGGGMHKAGVLAAAGLVALRETPPRIPDDHRRAKRLGELLPELKPLSLAYPVCTNIVDLVFDPARLDGERLVASAADSGVGITGPWNSPKSKWIRLVTHYGITDQDIEEAAGVVAEAVRESVS
jgi:threonine aldolase